MVYCIAPHDRELHWDCHMDLYWYNKKQWVLIPVSDQCECVKEHLLCHNIVSNEERHFRMYNFLYFQNTGHGATSAAGKGRARSEIYFLFYYIQDYFNYCAWVLNLRLSNMLIISFVKVRVVVCQLAIEVITATMPITIPRTKSA